MIRRLPHRHGFSHAATATASPRHCAATYRVIGHYVLLCGAGCYLWTRGFSGRRVRPWGRAAWCALRQPAREPSASRASIGASTRCPARPRRPHAPQPACTAARPCGPSGARHTGVWCADRWFRTSASNRAGSPVMSHVIPVPIFQTLKCGCWNCNVCGLSRKVTALNYVRNLAGGGVVVAHVHCSPRAPQPGPVSGGRPGPVATHRHPPRRRWGFGSTTRWLSACRRRVAPLVVQFPPSSGGETAT